MKKLIWVYWTLKEWYWNSYLLRGAVKLRDDFAKIQALSWSGFPVATFTDTSAGESWHAILKIEVYEVIDEQMLSNLDRLEWHPNWYRRMEITTHNWLQIEIYNMPDTQWLKDTWLTDQKIDGLDVYNFSYNYNR